MRLGKLKPGEYFAIPSENGLQLFYLDPSGVSVGMGPTGESGALRSNSNIVVHLPAHTDVTPIGFPKEANRQHPAEVRAG